MTHVHNDPMAFKEHMLEGFVAAYSRYVERVPGASGVMRRGGPRDGKVGVVVGGGSGHYPAFCGIVGPGFADGAVVGDVFTSPSAEQAYRVARAVDGGSGVLFSYGNYAGDVLHFGAAQDRLRDEGHDVRTVLVTDDVASAPVTADRRGIAGDFTVFKLASAAAERGGSLDDVEQVAVRVNARTRTFGVAFAGCILPGASAPLFTVEPGRMEFGLGIHGEPGVRSVPALGAEDLARALLDPVLAEAPADADGRVAVLVNGLGGTKYEELFVLARTLLPALEEAGLRLVLPEVGELVTSLDMAGCSLTVTWLDDELTALWQAPADTPAFRRGDTAKLARSSTVHRPATVAARPPAPAQAPAQTLHPAARNGGDIVRAALAGMLAVVAGHEAELGRLDAVAGDGDHGRGMVRGLRAARDAARNVTGLAQSLIAAGRAWSDEAGGTSGMLWGAALQTLGEAFDDGRAPTREDVVRGVGAAVETVARLGGAQPGDKTMLDAMWPFAQRLREAVETGARLAPAWAQAAAVARSAARGTANLLARKGRARPMAARALGTPDPGATSFALAVAAVADVLGEREHAATPHPARVEGRR